MMARLKPGQTAGQATALVRAIQPQVQDSDVVVPRRLAAVT